MRVQRTLPPAAAPLSGRDMVSGIVALSRGREELLTFRQELKKHFAVNYCYLLSSGRAALTVILKALKNLYPDRGDVLIPAYTCYSVPSAVVRAGLKVQLCDMDPERLDFDYTRLRDLLGAASTQPAGFDKPGKLRGPRRPPVPLLAVIPAHLYGIPSDIDRLRLMMGQNGAAIVEDAAQAMGGSANNRKLGTIGDVGFFSLGRGKAISTVEGGIILTNRKDIGWEISKVMSGVPHYGVFDLMKLMMEGISLTLWMRPSLFWFPKSLPFLGLGETLYDPGFKIRRMSPFQAGLAKNWRTKMAGFQELRRQNTTCWSTFVNDLKAHDLLPIHHPPDADLIRFPLRVRDHRLRKAILNQSGRKGLGIMPGYPDSIDGIEALRRDFGKKRFQVAKEYSRQIITLPVHPLVSQADMRKIRDLIGRLAQ